MEPTIEYAGYPLLSFLAWNRATPTLTPAEALALYETARGQVDPDTMVPHERALFDRLVREIGHGVFLG